MSETELEKIKVRTAKHFENDKNNISWLKEGKFSYCWFSINVKIVLLFISKKEWAEWGKLPCSSNDINTSDFLFLFFFFFGLSGRLRVFSIEMPFVFLRLQDTQMILWVGEYTLPIQIHVNYTVLVVLKNFLLCTQEDEIIWGQVFFKW